MKTILVLGAGRSATVLIEYLHQQARQYAWRLRVADQSQALALAKTQHLPHAEALALDIADEAALSRALAGVDVVISLLPPPLHPQVAPHCLAQRCHLLTASYVSPAMAAFDGEARQRDLLFLNECGLDPGIDHLSAMEMIDEVRAAGGIVTSFRSYCGGLIAPESDDNPWHYKFTWNPRNIVLAGQSGARYLSDHAIKYIPYQRLFERTDLIEITGWGTFEAYANRDSVHYRELYGLPQTATLLRGTLRRPGFCSAWNVLVQLGLTDDSYRMENSEQLTYRSWLEAFLPPHRRKNLRQAVADYVKREQGSPELECLAWLGLFEDEPVGLADATPAQVLQQLLETRWQLSSTDRDMIVMHHQLEAQIDGKTERHLASLGVTGDDPEHTAMAKTVGLPLGMAARRLLLGEVLQRGVQIPIFPDIYRPVLSDLAEWGIRFWKG